MRTFYISVVLARQNNARISASSDTNESAELTIIIPRCNARHDNHKRGEGNGRESESSIESEALDFSDRQAGSGLLTSSRIRATFESVPRGLNYQSISSFSFIGQPALPFMGERNEENGESLPGISPLRRGAKLSELIRAILHANTSPCSQRDVGAEHRELKVIKPPLPEHNNASRKKEREREREGGREKKFKLRVRLCFNSRLRM